VHDLDQLELAERVRRRAAWLDARSRHIAERREALIAAIYDEPFC
jgi:hypothetical protein